MRVIVCGGRDFTNHILMNSTMKELHERFKFTCVIHGDARGADRMAAFWANKHGIATIPYPADWNTYGNSAGPIRNTEMLREEKPDMVIAFPGGSGTRHMVKISNEAGVPVMEIHYPDSKKSLF